MKTQSLILLRSVSKEVLEALTVVTEETLAESKKTSPVFTIADLYKIQKQRRLFPSRRRLLV